VYQNIHGGKPHLFIVMELLTGGELFTRINERTVAAFTEKDASNIIFSICSAVLYLHKLNIAHRDIKPENLIYSEPGEKGVLKLIDFGFAKRFDDDENEEDKPSKDTPLYTPYYSSPEVLSSRNFHKPCDIWAIGVITYILLSGYPPFSSTSGSQISPEMRERIITAKYNFLGPEWSRVSEAAKDFIRRCLIADPTERATIENLMSHKWIKHYNKNPNFPLSTTQILSNKSNASNISDGIEHALATMRVDDFHIKQIDKAINPLLEKRRNSSTLKAFHRSDRATS